MNATPSNREFNPLPFSNLSEKLRGSVSKPFYFREPVYANVDGVRSRGKPFRQVGEPQIAALLSNACLSELVSFAHARAVSIEDDDLKTLILRKFDDHVEHALMQQREPVTRVDINLQHRFGVAPYDGVPKSTPSLAHIVPTIKREIKQLFVEMQSNENWRRSVMAVKLSNVNPNLTNPGETLYTRRRPSIGKRDELQRHLRPRSRRNKIPDRLHGDSRDVIDLFYYS